MAKDPRQAARDEEEARQAAILAATEKRNAEIIDGADPDPNVGVLYERDGTIIVDSPNKQSSGKAK
jgi:hypothetical protein